MSQPGADATPQARLDLSGTGVEHPTVEELAQIDLFADLDAEQLVKWTHAAELSCDRAGVNVRQAGQSAGGVILLLEGTMEALLNDRGTETAVSDHVAPTWIGA